jgi:hypothetical protein
MSYRTPALERDPAGFCAGRARGPPRASRLETVASRSRAGPAAQIRKSFPIPNTQRTGGREPRAAAARQRFGWRKTLSCGTGPPTPSV